MVHSVTDVIWPLDVYSNNINNRMFFVLFRDSPVVQGNSILALSGLAAALAKYESNLPADSDGSLGVTNSIFEPSHCVIIALRSHKQRCV